MVGGECAVCGSVDFLPFPCSLCRAVFCAQHTKGHGCDAAAPVPSAEGESSPLPVFPCALPGCHQSERVAVACLRCQSNFCLRHRHPPDHKCPEVPLSPEEEQTRQAEARLKQIVASRQEAQSKEEEEAKKSTDEAAPKKLKGSKNPKLAAKVQLMRLKGKARVCGGASTLDRLHFLVLLPEPRKLPNGSAHSCVAYPDQWKLGRALDELVSSARLPGQDWCLLRHSDGVALPLGDTLHSLVEGGELRDGETLLLAERGENDLGSYQMPKML